jgi:hypothetical protein
MKLVTMVLITSLFVAGVWVAVNHESEETPKVKKFVVLGFDVSSSIGPAERARWRPIAERSINLLAPGDTLLALQVHDHTVDAAPLFRGVMPTQPDAGAPLDEQRDFKRQLMKFRADATQALQQAFDGQALITDLFGVLDRLPSGSYLADVILFTDGLNSTQELNLEKTRLTEELMPEVIQKLGKNHRWTGQTLAGVSVRIVLPSRAAGDRNNFVNDKSTLSVFYRTLVESLGGQLKTFGVEVED